MNKLQVTDKGVNDIMLKHTINDRLARVNRYSAVCTTVFRVYSGYKNVEGAFLVTRFKAVPRGLSQSIGVLIERERTTRRRDWWENAG